MVGWYGPPAAQRQASFIIPLFVDIVSKNGNLLLSIPLPGHGQPESDEISFLNELAEWQRVNSEAIKGTRPWKSFGEGPSTEAKKTAPYQLSQLKFDHTDIRFTTKGKTLYAIALGWPMDGKILIKSLAENAANYPHQIRKVELLGVTSELKWTREHRASKSAYRMFRRVSMHSRSESLRAKLSSPSIKTNSC